MDGGVPELEGEPGPSRSLLGPELALSVSASAVSSVFMMQIL